MNRTLKLTVSILAGILVLIIAAYFFLRDARTLYIGYVEINPVSLEEIELRLNEVGCIPMSNAEEYYDGTARFCFYETRSLVPHSISTSGETGIEVYPHGLGFGPLSIYLTEEKVYAVKDIYGLPNSKKFRREVLEDINQLGGIISTHENSWEITKIDWPVTYVY